MRVVALQIQSVGGARKTKSMGIRKIRLCKGCGRKFTPKNQKPVEVERTQALAAQDGAADIVGPENSMALRSEQPDLIEPQKPEQ